MRENAKFSDLYSAQTSLTQYSTSSRSFAEENIKHKGQFFYERGEFILPESICKRDNISKYYKLNDEIIGEGGSGQVFTGERNGQRYAIKRINKAKIKYPETAIYEATICISLNHKNIIKFYEIYEDLKFISYVMELGEGGDLFDFITGAPNGHLPIDIVIDLLIQMFEVVDYLHTKANIIHRDLKPENFMINIDRNNRPIIKLIDFDLSVEIPPFHQKLKHFVGTENYSAPEVCLKKGYTEKVDEWALGVIMFNMITGSEPFQGKLKREIMKNICEQPIPFEYIQDKDLQSLIRGLLERDPEKRITARQALQFMYKIKNRNQQQYFNSPSSFH